MKKFLLATIFSLLCAVTPGFAQTVISPVNLPKPAVLGRKNTTTSDTINPTYPHDLGFQIMETSNSATAITVDDPTYTGAYFTMVLQGTAVYTFSHSSAATFQLIGTSATSTLALTGPLTAFFNSPDGSNWTITTAPNSTGPISGGSLEINGAGAATNIQNGSCTLATISGANAQIGNYNLDATCYQHTDEFDGISSNYQGGSSGGTIWTTQNGAFPTIAGIPGPSNTGAFEFLSTTAAVDNEFGANQPGLTFYGAYGNVSAYTNWTAEWTVDLHQTSAETLRFGLGDGYSAATAGALYIRYDTASADTTFHAICSVNGTGITQNTNTAIAPTATHVYRFGVQSTTTGTIAMYIYDNGSLVYGPTTICSSTNVPTTNLGEWAAISNIAAVTEVDFDRYVWRRTGVTGR